MLVAADWNEVEKSFNSMNRFGGCSWDKRSWAFSLSLTPARKVFRGEKKTLLNKRAIDIYDGNISVEWKYFRLSTSRRRRKNVRARLNYSALYGRSFTFDRVMTFVVSRGEIRSIQSVDWFGQLYSVEIKLYCVHATQHNPVEWKTDSTKETNEGKRPLGFSCLQTYEERTKEKYGVLTGVPPHLVLCFRKQIPVTFHSLSMDIHRTALFYFFFLSFSSFVLTSGLDVDSLWSWICSRHCVTSAEENFFFQSSARSPAMVFSVGVCWSRWNTISGTMNVDSKTQLSICSTTSNNTSSFSPL